MKNSALGLIETYGFVGAVEAAAAALKAAGKPLPKPDVGRFSQHALLGDYRALIHSLLASSTSGIQQ